MDEQDAELTQPEVVTGNRGWGTPVVLTLVAAALSVVINPGLLLFLPLALMFIALPPRRPLLLGLGVFLLSLSIAGPSGDQLWWFARGWALMLGAWFVATSAVAPRSPFIARGLIAVAGTVVSSVALFLASRNGWTQLNGLIGNRMRAAAAAAAAQWAPLLGARAVAGDAAGKMQRAADVQVLIYPAMLALASLSALAVVWWVWRRVTVREARPLSRLREFRFRDELIWVVVAAVLLLVLPLNDLATRTGTNLATFMGALYALRGLGVALALFGAPGPLGVVFGVIATLFLFPMVIAATLVLGLSDTWLDLRSKLAMQKQ